MAVDRTPVLKRCRSLGMEPMYLGIDKKSIFGYKPEEIKDYPQDSEIKYLPIKNDLYIGYWGVAIFGEKSHFSTIPQEMKIWCGDNFLLKTNQDKCRKNFKLRPCW